MTINGPNVKVQMVFHYLIEVFFLMFVNGDT
jgi:hypothetical protein